MVTFATTTSKSTAVGTTISTARDSAFDTDTIINTEGVGSKAKIAVAGATGYVGQELIKLLLAHPKAQLVALASNSHAGKPFCQVVPGFAQPFAQSPDLTCTPVDLEALAEQSDIVFLCLPHGVSSTKVSPSLLSSSKIIDLSGDFRLTSAIGSGAQSAKVAYGLCEINREAILQADLVANPGCYATAAILALAPLVKAGLIAEDSIIIDGKSGVSGAGRQASLQTHFNECNESMKAYQLPSHRHTPEIEQALSAYGTGDVITTFAAHLVPMNRGILLTAYAQLLQSVDDNAVAAIYEECFAAEPFIRIYSPGKNLPETRWVKGSNYCDIGFAVDRRANRIVVVSAIDNLIKGAAGQAVQNMNILLGIDETTGLKQIPTFL